MEMRIEEAIIIISDIDKAYRTFTPEEIRALETTLNVMRKYQKIVQIMNVGKNSNNTNIVDTWLYENISKVLSEQGELEDGNNTGND